MNKRTFLRSLLLSATASCIAPSIFIPKLIEVPKWKKPTKPTHVRVDLSDESGKTYLTMCDGNIITSQYEVRMVNTGQKGLFNYEYKRIL